MLSDIYLFCIYRFPTSFSATLESACIHFRGSGNMCAS